MNDNFTEVRNGLTNYIFACLNGLPYEGVKAKHALISILAEESLNLSKDENNNIELFAIKPMLRAVVVVFDERIKCLKEAPSSEAINKQIAEYTNLVNIINNLINNINEN